MSIQPEAVGGLLATVGAALLTLGGSQVTGTTQDLWSNPWFDAGCAAVSAGAAPLIVLSVVSWWRSRRQRIPEEARITAHERPDPDQDSPLHLLAQPGTWRLFDRTAWSFGLPVRVTNITEKPITLAHYRLLNKSDQAPRPPFVPHLQSKVDAAIAALSAEHGLELFIGEIIVPPGESITRWFIGSTYALLPEGDRPALTIQFEDVSGDTYNVHIPARKRHEFHR